jgi:hypothetical protein
MLNTICCFSEAAQPKNTPVYRPFFLFGLETLFCEAILRFISNRLPQASANSENWLLYRYRYIPVNIFEVMTSMVSTLEIEPLTNALFTDWGLLMCRDET